MASLLRTLLGGPVVLLIFAVALTAAAAVRAEREECGFVRAAIAENGQKADEIEHFLTVAEMTRAATVSYLADLADRRRKIIGDLIRYGRLGCDWNRLTYAPKPR